MRLPPIPRAPGITNRQVAVGLGGRFFDELLSGLPFVLMPTFQRLFGLTYTQVSALSLTLDYVAAVIEPINGLLLDVWDRRWTMAWGAVAVGASIVVIGVAPTFALLLVGFGLYGLGSGPLAHSGDVILVESHPTAPDRIFARSVFVDSIGALLGPLLISATIWIGLSWRWLLIALGASSFLYAVIILRTRLPLPQGRESAVRDGMRAAIRHNVRIVWQHPQARLWLGFLFVFGILETPFHFKTVWLAQQVGMSQGLIGVYVAVELVAGMVGLLALDRWRSRTSAKRILQLATLGVAILYPLWLLVPGVWARFALAVPLEFLFAVFWPIGKAQSLTAVPGRAGVTTAVHSLFGLVPFTLLFGLLADKVTLTKAMLGVHVVVILVMGFVVWQLKESGSHAVKEESAHA